MKTSSARTHEVSEILFCLFFLMIDEVTVVVGGVLLFWQLFGES